MIPDRRELLRYNARVEAARQTEGHPMRHEWRDRALCAGYDTEAWFPDGTGSDFEVVARPAKAVCRVCDVRLACLAFALDAEGKGAERTRYGIFGGMGPAERAELVRRGAA